MSGTVLGTRETAGNDTDSLLPWNNRQAGKLWVRFSWVAYATVGLRSGKYMLLFTSDQNRSRWLCFPFFSSLNIKLSQGNKKASRQAIYTRCFLNTEEITEMVTVSLNRNDVSFTNWSLGFWRCSGAGFLELERIENTCSDFSLTMIDWAWGKKCPHFRRHRNNEKKNCKNSHHHRELIKIKSKIVEQHTKIKEISATSDTSRQ